MNNCTKFILLSFFILVSYLSKAQPFVTKWDMANYGGSPTEIAFAIDLTDTVHYTWETIPAGSSGSGYSTSTYVLITGLPAGALIRLSIDTAHLIRFRASGGIDSHRLLDVEQWGGVHWSTMQNAFFGCSNLAISATDVPDLTLVTDLSGMFKNCSTLNSPTNIDSWNVSGITTMSEMFSGATNFNQPIVNWDVSNVVSFYNMFYQASAFNQPIGNWNVSNAINFLGFFKHSTSFNQPLGNWNLMSADNLSMMFQDATSFNQPLGNWNITNVTNLSMMFQSATSFNQPLGTWNTQNVTNMGNMFAGATSFNQSLNTWNTQNVTNMGNMFASATSFNQPLNVWNTQNVESMSWMFANATSFNQPLNAWNIQNVVTTSHMFSDATLFNQPLNTWNTQNVVGMTGMFFNAISFNQPLSNWNTQSVQYMGSMFYGATSFNEPIGSWNTQSVTDMSNMFYGATSFNQPIGSWNIGNILYMNSMFKYATSFNQSLEDWVFSQNANTASLLDSSGMDCMHYSATLNGWANALNLPNGKSIGAANMKYKLNAISARNYLINVKGWTILGDALDNSNCCVTQQTTSNIATCNSYPFNGQVYTASGTYLDTLVSANGCDSIVTLNLTILQPTFNTINETACSSYLFNGQSLTSSGMYYDTLVNANGCDSILSLNLTINQTNVTVFQAGAYLYTSGSGASYQWLRCNPYQEIAGETGSSYTAAANGDYALVVTQNGCTDTSACVTVMGIGLDEYSNDDKIIIYPNPAQDRIYVTSTLSDNQNAKKELYNTLGQILLTTYENEIDVRALVKGVYYVRCGQLVEKLIVE